MDALNMTMKFSKSMKIQSTYLHAKPALTNIQVVNKIFDQALTIVDVFAKPFEREKDKQKSFSVHFKVTSHDSWDHSEVRLIELTNNVQTFQEKVYFLQPNLDTFQSNGLNKQSKCLFKKTLLCTLLND